MSWAKVWGQKLSSCEEKSLSHLFNPLLPNLEET